jgi:hypothetical protein
MSEKPKRKYSLNDVKEFINGKIAGIEFEIRYHQNTYRKKQCLSVQKIESRECFIEKLQKMLDVFKKKLEDVQAIEKIREEINWEETKKATYVIIKDRTEREEKLTPIVNKIKKLQENERKLRESLKGITRLTD